MAYITLVIFLLPQLSWSSSLTFLSADTTQIVVSLTPDPSSDLVALYEVYVRKGSDEWKRAAVLTPPNSVAVVTNYDGDSLEAFVEYSFKAEGVKGDGSLSSSSEVYCLTVEEPISLIKSRVKYSESIMRNEETEIVLEAYTSSGAKKIMGGDIIYLNITNGCRKGPNIKCIRLTPGEPYYSNDVLSQPKIIRMEDNRNGTYTAKYTITEKTGYISLTFSKITNGKLYGECFAGRDLEAEKIDTLLTEEFDFFWADGENVCGGRDGDVSIQWVGKIVAPLTKTVSFKAETDDETNITIDNEVVLEVFWETEEGDDVGEFDFVKDAMYDISVRFYEGPDKAFVRLWWDLNSSGDYELVTSQYFWYPQEVADVLYVEVVCEECPEGRYNLGQGCLCDGECNRLCTSCFGPAIGQCHECRSEVPNVAMVQAATCGCRRGYYYDDSDGIGLEEYCKPCGSFCSHCVDSSKCLVCSGSDGIRMSGGECKCNVPGYMVYENKETGNEECVKCHPLCSACFGPSATQCYSCSETPGTFLLGKSTCGCAWGYYDVSSESCAPCHALCSSCFGPSNAQCSACLHSHRVEDDPSLCVSHCALLDGYYFDRGVCRSNVLVVVGCHYSCESCYGGGEESCLACRELGKVLEGGKCENECSPGHLAVLGICHSISPPMLE